MANVASAQLMLTGIHLDGAPIYFDEGGMPAFLEWQRWLQLRRRELSLKLRVDVVTNNPVRSITVTVTRDGAQQIR